MNKTLLTILILLTGIIYSCSQKSGNTETDIPEQLPKTMQQKADLFPELENYLKNSLSDSNQIAEERQQIMREIAAYVEKQISNHGKAKLTFICTHNSRRSHMGQIWAKAAAAYYGFGDNVETFSGGTEATAFNPRAVKAVADAGLKIENPGGQNPHYLVHYSDAAPPMECFSKKFDDMFNPKSGFGAVMTCSDADANCPVVPGAEARFVLTYEDPKEADGTPEEQARYAERSKQIAGEMMWLMRLIADKINN